MNPRGILVASSPCSHTPWGGGALEKLVTEDGPCVREIHMLGEVARLKGKHFSLGPDNPGLESCVTLGELLNFSGLVSLSVQWSL